MPKKLFLHNIKKINILQDITALYKILKKGKSGNSFKYDGTDGWKILLTCLKSQCVDKSHTYNSWVTYNKKNPKNQSE